MKKWSEIMKENKEEILVKMVDAFKEAEGGMSGWHIGIEIDQDGDVWTTGILSSGSQSVESWEGKTTIVTWINTWNVDYDDRDFLSDPDNAYLEAEFDDYKKVTDDELLPFEDFMMTEHPEILEVWDAQAIEVEIDAFYDNAADLLDNEISLQIETESCDE